MSSLFYSLLHNVLLGDGCFAVDAANSLPSSLTSALTPNPRIAKGNPGAGANAIHIIDYDPAKMTQVLGIKKEDLWSEVECAEAMIKVWVERGW